MNDKFWDLKKEKQDRIINAALQVFTQWGYKKASTDEIVKVAGISKGLLFHYFVSKKGLYNFVYGYSAKYMEMEFSRCVGLKEDDFFVLQGQLEQAKAQVMRQYPYMSQFLNSAFLEQDEEVIKEIEEVMDHYSETLRCIYAKADLCKFQPDVNPSLLLKVILLAVDGLRAEQAKAGRVNPEALYQETMETLQLFQNHFYQNTENQ